MTEFEKFQEIVRKLRAPDGCPWDRAQTHTSLKPECVEEAAEVVCGIDVLEETGESDNLKEELGDLLLQVVMHAVIAEEEGLFTMDDILREAGAKMIRRHPHVFPPEEYPDQQIDLSGISREKLGGEKEMTRWEMIKKAEKSGREWTGSYLPAAFDEAEQLIDVARKRKGFSPETSTDLGQRRCPCCGRHFFEEKNAYEICPVCGWEDDPLQRKDPEFAGGANGKSLQQARREFRSL